MIRIVSAALLAASAALASALPGWPGPPGFLTCSAEVNGLIAGIEVNILAQQGERNATEALQAIEAQNSINVTAFAAGKAILVNDIRFGMTIRRYNQLIAPAGNAALPGLAKYASAQATELSLAQSLTGDSAHDASVLATLINRALCRTKKQAPVTTDTPLLSLSPDDIFAAVKLAVTMTVLALKLGCDCVTEPSLWFQIAFPGGKTNAVVVPKVLAVH